MFQNIVLSIGNYYALVFFRKLNNLGKLSVHSCVVVLREYAMVQQKSFLVKRKLDCGKIYH